MSTVSSHGVAVPRPTAPVTPNPFPALEPTTGAPREWQWHLVELLSRLETRRQQCATLRLGPDADAILDQCEAMAQLTEDVASKTKFADALAPQQLEAIAKAGELFTACNEARRPASRSLFQSMLQALGGQESPEQVAGVVKALGLMTEALHTYFALFTAHYPSSKAARGFVDAASAFLADFKQTARELTATQSPAG